MQRDFYGRNLSDRQLDLVTIEVIPPELQKGEPKLYRTKWWDYRHMHPMRATYLFASEYERAYRRVIQKRLESSKARKLRVFRTPDPMREASVKAIGLWKGRRLADEYGIRYDFYCRIALDASEYLDWEYLARPEDLTNSALTTRVLLAWLEINEATIQLPEDPIYRGRGEARSYYQDEWEEALCKQIARRKNPQHALDYHLNTTGLLSESTVRRFFGDELTDRVLGTKISKH